MAIANRHRIRSLALALLTPALLALAFLVPTGASAASYNFIRPDVLVPPGIAIFGPASIYPSSVEVSGLEGTVSKATVTFLGVSSGSADDIDALLVGPDGQQVMLMSDACGEGALVSRAFLTFDDDATSMLPDKGPCPSNQAASFRPSNFVGNSPEPDQFGAGGGIAPPYGNSLAVFDGTSPNGPWDLFARDDNESTLGLEISGWMLTLDVQPPPAPPAPPALTGKRARALAKCKKKKTSKARKRCRANARKLPR